MAARNVSRIQERRSGKGMFVRMSWLVAVCVCAAGQTVTMTDVSRARESVARAKGLTEPEVQEISKLYDQATQALKEEIRWKAQQVGHARNRAVIEKELEAARAAALLPMPGPYPAPPSETVQQVEDELARVRNNRASVVKRRDELSKLRASLAIRRDEITARRSAVRESLQSIADEVSVLSLASASLQWEQAGRMAMQARRQSLEQELESLGAERETLDLRRQLIPMQREAYLLRLEADEQQLLELGERQNKARLRDAKKSLEDAVAEAQLLAKGFPQLAGISAEIARDAGTLWGAEGIEAKSAQAAAKTEEMSSAVTRFKAIMADTKRRFENSGVFSPASDWWPPKVEKYGKPAEVGVLVLGVSAAEALARRDLFKLEEARNGAPALETELQQFLAAAGKKENDADFAEFKSRSRSMLQLKRNILAEFLTESRTYVNRLSEAHRVAEELLTAIGELQSFVMQRVLWVRSVGGSVLPLPSISAKAILWFFSVRSWSQILAGFIAAKATAVLWMVGAVVILGLFLIRVHLRKMFEASRLAAMASGRIGPKLYSLTLGLLSALPVPLSIAYAGWVIGQAGEAVDLGRALSSGAGHAARFLYMMLLVRMMLADGGVADRLMAWPKEVRGRLDWGTAKLAWIFTPLWFVSSALAGEGMYFTGDSTVQSYHDSLGRLCFMLAVGSQLYIGRRMLRRRGAVAQALGSGYDAHGVAWGRVARLGSALVLGMAFLLALSGFYITAYLTVKNLITTAGWTIALVLASSILRQWRNVQQDRVAASHAPQDELLARQSDLQVRRLSRFGLTLVWLAGALFIWSAALPALSMLKRVELSPEFRFVRDTAQAPESQPGAAEARKTEAAEPSPSQPAVLPIPASGKPAEPAKAAQPREPLYLTDVLLAIFVGILIAMLVGNIPGLLQFTVFRRFDLDVGGQYAVNTIARYFVIMVGLGIVSAILNVNWSSIQWLAAALTFGIGFGLQEIFANFAAGLILLVDRSIRVGDVVTVGTLSGIVANIRMRATTITLWDRSDMVVPNKEFITTKLVNWTLSNPETRVDVKVGVAYDSDVEQVRAVLMRLAEEHPAVMKTPEPQVLLTEFAGSAILFELRVFGMYSYGRPVLLDELYRAVLREFRKLGIVIAFPQLDVHLKTAEAAPAEPSRSPAGIIPEE